MLMDSPKKIMAPAVAVGWDVDWKLKLHLKKIIHWATNKTVIAVKRTREEAGE